MIARDSNWKSSPLCFASVVKTDAKRSRYMPKPQIHPERLSLQRPRARGGLLGLLGWRGLCLVVPRRSGEKSLALFDVLCPTSWGGLVLILQAAVQVRRDHEAFAPFGWE